MVIPNSVASIGDFAFSNCFNLISISIPHSVKDISPFCFEGCTMLEKIIISKGSRVLCEKLLPFDNDKLIEQIDIPD